jgi:hypothetical protein
MMDGQPHLRATAPHLAAFAEMMLERYGERLNARIAAVNADKLPDLYSFTAGLRRDHDAVLNGRPCQQLRTCGRPHQPA